MIERQQQRHSEDMETGLDEVAFAMDALLRSDRETVKHHKENTTINKKPTTQNLDEREYLQEPVTINSGTVRTGTICDIPPTNEDRLSQ